MRLHCANCGSKLLRLSKDEWCCPSCKDILFSELEDDVKDPRDYITELNEGVDLHYAIKKLPEKQQQIAKLLGEGYTWREIKEKLNTYDDYIAKTIEAIKEQMNE